MLRVALLSGGPDLSIDALQLDPAAMAAAKPDIRSATPDTDPGPAPGSTEEPGRVKPLAEVERAAIEQAMQVAGGNASVAAHLLGISASTIYRKLKEYSH